MGNKSLGLVIGAFLMAFGQLSFAGQASDNAREHFNLIGNGDVGSLMSGYTSGAVLNWVGGPLDGSYASPDAIRSLWEKFSKAQGTLKVSVDKLEESANPKGSTITANVKFEGKVPISVRYVLVYRDGKIVSETWQVDPNLMVGALY